VARAKPVDSDAQSLEELRAQEEAHAAAEEAAEEAAAGGATPLQAKAAAKEAAEEALASFRLHDEDVERIATRNASATVDLLRESGAFDPPAEATPQTPPPADGTPAPVEATAPDAPEPPAPPPRKLSVAEKFAGVDG